MASEEGNLIPATAVEIDAFLIDFEACTLPETRWTHQAHLIVGLWYLWNHTPEEAFALVRQRIRAYNEAVGTPNTDIGGYHESLTRLYLLGIAAHMTKHGEAFLSESLAVLLQSPLAR